MKKKITVIIIKNNNCFRLLIRLMPVHAYSCLLIQGQHDYSLLYKYICI